MIDKKKMIKTSIIIVLILIIIAIGIMLIKRSNAKYESQATTNKDVDVAFWISDNSIKTQRLTVENIYPSETPYTYTFSVSNYEGAKKAEAALEYEISIIGTGNLPLDYDIYKNGTKLKKSESIIQDKYETCYKKVIISPEENDLVLLPNAKNTQNYELKITFPKKYEGNYEYADSIVDIKMELSARQKIEEVKEAPKQ